MARAPPTAARRRDGAAPRRAAAPAPPAAARAPAAPRRRPARVAGRSPRGVRARAAARRAARPRSRARPPAAGAAPGSRCVGVLLAGIVFFNVALLELNGEHRGDEPSRPRRSSARTRACGCELARLGSSERIQRGRASAGFVLPAPGDVRYLGRPEPRRRARAGRPAASPRQARSRRPRRPRRRRRPRPPRRAGRRRPRRRHADAGAGDHAAGTGRPARRRDRRCHAATATPGRRLAVRLVERRIGLLFALFLALLALAAVRAAWLGTVKAGELGAARVSQQVEDLDVPRPPRHDHRPQRRRARGLRGRDRPSSPTRS